MAAKSKDPTDPIRLRASRYPDVAKGTACTQSSFKVGKKSFLFIGMQGGRYKAMFKLSKSMAEAKKLATKHPDDYQAGSTGWVTARFSAEKPMPKTRWTKWLDESYELGQGGSANKSTSRRKSSKKKSIKKKAAGKKASRKRASAKKSTKKRSSKKKAGKKR